MTWDIKALYILKRRARLLKNYPNYFPRLKLVLRLREEGKTFREIGELIDDKFVLSIERARQLYKKALFWKVAGLMS